MSKKHLLAAKADAEFHADSHAAAKVLGTNVSREILALMRRLIKRAEKVSK